MSGMRCLEEPVLWTALSGESVPENVAAHLRDCSSCGGRLERLRGECFQMRSIAQESGLDDSENTAAPGNPEPVRPAAPQGIEPRTEDGAVRPPLNGACPARIGRYPVHRLLKVGGQATVYLAHHPALQIDVVIKWSHTSSRRPCGNSRPAADSQREAESRLEAEARLLAGLRHPYLAQVYDLGIEDDRPFIVLEYIPGQELSRFGERPMSPPVAALLIARIARALAAVHARGVLHLDVQPANIIVGSDGVPKLIDFGCLLRRDAPEARATAAGFGTPPYMAPEHLAGDSSALDVLADVYGLGAVLYELLTGSPPLPELIWQLAPARGMAAHTEAFPPALRTICHKALHPDPARRFASANALADALEDFAAGRRSWRRGMAGAAVLLTAATLMLWSSKGPRACSGGSLGPWGYSESPGHTCGTDGPGTGVPADVCRETSDCSGSKRELCFLMLHDGRVLPFNPPPPGASHSHLIKSAGGDVAQLRAAGEAVLLLRIERAAAHRTTAVPEAASSESMRPSLPPGVRARFTECSLEWMATAATPAERDRRADIECRLLKLQAAIAECYGPFEAWLVPEGHRIWPPEEW